MRKALMVFGVLAMVTTPALGAIGDWWVLPVDRLDGDFTVYPGCGYDCGSGPTDCYEGSGMDGVRRVWWNTDNSCESSGAAMPANLEEFTIEAFGCTSGGQDWQPIQVQINGYHGPLNWPIDPEIPWAGQFGTNHEWVGSNGVPNGAWNPTGPGPQVHPDGNGSTPFIKAGSVLYAKWDFGWPITRTWDSIRITQVTPEPASALLLLLGAPMLLRRKRR